MLFTVREMAIEDYDEVYRLWTGSDGVNVSGADSPEGVARYLRRNPGSSFVAVREGRIVGAILGGHDGRRGYIHHLSVAENSRFAGVGTALVEHAISAIRAQHIQKCHIFVVKEHREGIAFWEKIGWKYRKTLGMMSEIIDG